MKQLEGEFKPPYSFAHPLIVFIANDGKVVYLHVSRRAVLSYRESAIH